MTRWRACGSISAPHWSRALSSSADGFGSELHEARISTNKKQIVGVERILALYSHKALTRAEARQTKNPACAQHTPGSVVFLMSCDRRVTSPPVPPAPFQSRQPPQDLP